MGFGPIPWTAIKQYADHVGLPRRDFPEFNALIKALDAEWLEWMRKESEKDD